MGPQEQLFYFWQRFFVQQDEIYEKHYWNIGVKNTDSTRFYYSTTFNIAQRYCW